MEKELFLKKMKELLNCENINLDTSLLDIDEWDSFSRVRYMAMVNEELGIVLPRFDVAEAESIGDLYNIILENQE